MKLLVTGARGFIGSHLTKHLIKKGYDVRVLLRNKKNLEFFKKLGTEVYFGDITKKESIKDSTEDIDCVFHLAGGGNFDDPYTYLHKINVKGTGNIIEDSKRNHVKKFIYCSSCSVTGPSNNGKINERSPYSPSNNYAKTKNIAEKIVLNERKLKTVVIRPGLVYGTPLIKTKKDFVAFDVLIKAIYKKKFVYLRNKNKKQHLTHINNLNEGFIKTLNFGKDKEIYIITDYNPIKVEEMVKIIAKEFNLGPPKYDLPPIAGHLLLIFYNLRNKLLKNKKVLSRHALNYFLEDHEYDISNSISTLGYKPKYTFEKAIKAIIAAYKKEGVLSGVNNNDRN